MTATTNIATLAERPKYSFWGRFARTFFRNKIAVVGLVIVITMLICAVFAPQLAPHNPNKNNVRDRLQPPSAEYFMGTDDYGRDIFSRLLFGAQRSLQIAVVSQTISIALGVLLGLISGWYGGLIDDLIMRLTDAIFAIPTLIFLVVWVSIFGSELTVILIGLGVVGWAADARMMRAQVLSMKEREFVVAARAMGASGGRIMAFHLLPNCIAPTIVLASLGVAGIILAESGLTFLGLGVQIPNASWGGMINDGGKFITSAWWYALFPGLAIMFTVLGFNFVGDGLRDALDPKLYEA
jgi:ABC-type dipeptide/oligopeptide/nickel transport system permease subunit